MQEPHGSHDLTKLLEEVKRVSNSFLSMITPVFLALLVVAGYARASDQTLDVLHDSLYLPISIEETGIRHDLHQEAVSVSNNVGILSISQSDSTPAVMFRYENIVDRRLFGTSLSIINYPPYEVKASYNTRTYLNDCRVYEDKITGSRNVVASGFWADSAFLIKFDSATKQTSRLKLRERSSATRDVEWSPQVLISYVGDYDFDNRIEALVYVNSGRFENSRSAHCVDLNSMTLEWSLPISSPIIVERGMYACGDSSTPALMFATNNPSQGYSDANYSDRFGYLSIIDRNGELLFKKVISVGIGGEYLVEAYEDGHFYLLHDIMPDSLEEVNLETNGFPETERCYLSLIDCHGNLEKTVAIERTANVIWTQPLGEDKNPVIGVGYISGTIAMYDTALTYIGAFKSLSMKRYHGLIRLPGGVEGLVYSNGIYSLSLERMAVFGSIINRFYPVKFNESGEVISMYLMSSNDLNLVNLSRSSLWDNVSLFYVRNKNPFLSLFILLLVGLLAALYYRHKTKLKLLSEREVELEKTKAALEVAHARILTQEKYRQAQDIAGGFAHEIRNALFPARTALSKLKKTTENDLADADRIQKMSHLCDRAIYRAITLTKMISDFTKLEDMKELELVNLRHSVDSVLEILQQRVDDQSVTVTIQCKDYQVQSNKNQFEIVLMNLLTNALDALTQAENPSILITSGTVDGRIIVRVADNGSGIKVDERKRVFDLFYSTKPDKGTGIGLTTAKKIVEMYGGSISVSELDNGWTAFDLSLKPA